MLGRLIKTQLAAGKSLMKMSSANISYGSINIANFINKKAASDPRYYSEEDASANEIPRGITEDTLLNVNLIVERIPVVPSMPKDWELEYSEYTKLKLYEQGTHFPDDFQKLINSKIGIRDIELGIEHVITKDDEANNLRSMHRCLNEPVYLLFKVEETDGKKTKTVWQFPRGEWRADETVRQTAERTIFYYAGEGLQYHMLGNAPIAYHSNEVPASLKKQFPTAKEVKVSILVCNI